MGWPWWATLLAATPLAVLTALVLRGWRLTRSAWLTVALSGALAVGTFGLDLVEVAWSAVRGAWTGVWILLIVLPALMLYEVLNRSGALEHLAAASDRLAPTEGRRLLLLAWVLPSFLQGAAGFGAPIAMSAPLLVRRGMAPVAAIAACMIGYQWSVTFGSMGSSYFMAEATARLSGSDAQQFALRTGIVLGISAMLSGLLVLTRGERTRGDLWRALAVGAVMAATLVGVVSIQPALGSTTAGLAGLLACWVLLPDRGTERPRGGDLVVAALPYAALAAIAVTAYAVPPVRALFDRIPTIAPVLPGVEASFGYSTAMQAVTPVFRPGLHPLWFLSMSVVVAVFAYRRRGWWPAGSTGEAVRAWRPRAQNVSVTLVGLTIVASILNDAGMIAALAQALATAFGIGFVALSAPLGTLGTLLTGSTTTSNAMFSSLQSEVATALAILPAILLVGQTAGGNVGNALAPGVATVGAAAVSAPGTEGQVIRQNLPAAGLLLVVTGALIAVQVWLFP